MNPFGFHSDLEKKWLSTTKQLNKTLWIIHDKYFSRIVSWSKTEQ